tara:strand:- start:383 stop:1582 length:1200 start_codon:yes stop_codon:yes gene_type:complete
MGASSFDSWTAALHTLNVSQVPSYGWVSLPKMQLYAPQWQLLDAATTSMLNNEEINQAGNQRKLLDVQSPVMVVSPWAVVISIRPIAVLDLAGGCCRPAAPISLKTSGIMKYVHRPRNHVDTEYGWLFLACHSHSTTYFHALGEAAAKLMWGLGLLQQNPDLRVLHASGFVDALLPLLNLTGRGVMYNGNFQLARRITLPPSAQLQAGLMGALRRTLFAQMTTPVAEADVLDSGAVIVVRRSAIAQNGGRALLNHDQLMFTLRFVLLDATTKLLEWPPEGKTLTQAVETWRTASVAIAPHGAGLTNMIFMPRGSTVVEIVAHGQKGRVYGALAQMMGHRYTDCYYRRNEHGTLNLSLPLPIRERFSQYTAFSLDLTYFMDECIGRARFPKRNQWGTAVG